MTRSQACALSLMAAACTLAGPAAAQQSGELVCRQEAQQLRDQLQRSPEALSRQEMRDADRRLSVAETECRGQPQLGQVNLSALRHDLRMEEIREQNQQAGVPGENPDVLGR